jgi:alcohol dehydrogenase
MVMLATQRFTLGSAPTQFGCGSIDRLPSVLASLGKNRALLVTDAGVAGAGIGERIERLLRGAGVATRLFDGINPNPSTDNLDAGAQAAREFAPGVVVAFGGGSVLDTAKGIALMAANDGPARDFDYRNEPACLGLPIVAIPTTAGTGAETNGFGVIDNHETGRKFYVGHESVIPRAVILDPELTRGLPPRQTAATGMDVLTHALESLSSLRSNPYADGISLQVVSMVFRYLPRATADGEDLEARSQLLLAAHIVGLAFATTGLGMGHGMAHALSARIGAPHGMALAVLLDRVLAFNLPVRHEVYARVALSLGVGRTDWDEQTNAAAAVAAVRELAHEVAMPDSLGALGLEEQHISQIVEDALLDEVMANTPRTPTHDELRAVLQAAL